ncbi:uncharacterized protein PV06_01049 [Exophiala oligosperma]|uniref:Clr5 domain-containing protein n=1 Tax=Exophiala oligosperma TaxID=215243 RepID=A0A0D2DZE5_9EURO|nr:uncharacterized protein PV06_01049 [Exophiala oligosperma]KIW48468.1 hypothetical protein PV06_01049 [Exophiala oligosperma]
MAVSLGNARGWIVNDNVAQTPAPATAATTTQLEAREGPAPNQWQAVKEEIRVLYEKKPLRDVKRILEQRHGFRATERMYKARLAQWGFSKNYSDKDYQICAVLHHARQKHGKRRTAFMIHGHKRSVKDLHKYIKGRKMSEDAFLATALKNVNLDSRADHEQAQYAHVRAYTPPPGGSNTPKAEVEGDESISSPTHLQSYGAGKHSSSRRDPLSRSGSGSFSMRRDSQPQRQATSPGSSLLFPTSSTQLTPPMRHPQVPLFSPSRNGSSVTWPSPSNLHLSTSPLEGSFTSAVPSHRSGQRPQLGSHDDHSNQGGSVHSSPCQWLGREVEYMALQVTEAPSLKSLCGHDDIHSWRLLSDSSSEAGEYEHVCWRCYEPSRTHFVSLPNLELPQQSRSILNENVTGGDSTISVPASSRDHQHSWRWVARCFAACIYLSRGDKDLSERSLADANIEFEQMLVPVQDPKVVLALNQTLQILHMHDQGEITREIMRSANNVATRVLGPDDPLTVITRWMVYVADLQMRDREITSSTLHEIYGHYLRLHGAEDPRCIAALYCYGFMLNVERKLEQAEQVLMSAYTISCANLGPRHLQSLSALTNMARCLERQGKLDQAIAMVERVIDDSRDTLGESHPRRLETMRILGTFLERRGDLAQTEYLYWKVLEGRIKMLGVNHMFTLGMKEDLVELLKKLGKWGEDPNGQSEAQIRIHDLFEWNPWEIPEDTGGSDGDLSDGVGSDHDAF